MGILAVITPLGAWTARIGVLLGSKTLGISFYMHFSFLERGLKSIGFFFSMRINFTSSINGHSFVSEPNNNITHFVMMA